MVKIGDAGTLKLVRVFRDLSWRTAGSSVTAAAARNKSLETNELHSRKVTSTDLASSGFDRHASV